MIADPFPHLIIDDFVPAELCRAAVAEWPDDRWPHWLRYDGERGRKLVTKDPLRLTPACAEILREMSRLRIADLTGIGDTFPDLALHGAGMSLIDRGGELPLHLDSDHHPVTGWERAFSAMVYLQTCGGGRLRLWDVAGRVIVKEIDPEPGRLVLFECSDRAWHSVEAVCESRRLSLSLFFWRFPTGAAPKRARAEFAPSPR